VASGCAVASGGVSMPFCDICSKVITKSAMTIKPASVIVRATSGGYVPKDFAGHSLYDWQVADSKIPRPLLWQMIVGRNGTGEWGLCGSCTHELNSRTDAQQEAEKAAMLGCWLMFIVLAAAVGGFAYFFPDSFFTWVRSVDWWSVVCYIAAGFCLLFAGASFCLIWSVPAWDGYAEDLLALSLLGLVPGGALFVGLFAAVGPFEWWYLGAFLVGVAAAAVIAGPWLRPARAWRAKMEHAEAEILGKYCARQSIERSWDVVIAEAEELARNCYKDRTVALLTAGWESAVYRDEAEARKACERGLRGLGIDPDSIKTTARLRREEHHLLQMLLKKGTPHALADPEHDPGDEPEDDADELG
jgi:hypothetical protein